MATKTVLLAAVLVSLVAGGLEAQVGDLARLSQDPLSYLEGRRADEPLLPFADQARLNAVSDEAHFSPWHMAAPRHSLEQVALGFVKYADNPGFGRGGKRHPANWLTRLSENARLDEYPQRVFPAITIRHCDFRVFPTAEPHNTVPRSPGSDYPFDNLQESSVPVGTPVLVTHMSRDKKWLLAETSYALGWVQAGSVARVDEDFMRRWQTGVYVAIIRDRTPILDWSGKRLFVAPVGAVFPKAGQEDAHVLVMAVLRGRDGKARLVKAKVLGAAVADKPLALTPRSVAMLARAMAGTPYGWGGWNGRRDCSSLLRDLFTPFGIWLPRNSLEQAQAGRFVPLKDLSLPDKEARILREGVPWRTLLWKPGHIMLYIGANEGRPLIFHSSWRATTHDGAGKKERVIVGRAAVTTLTPGQEIASENLPASAVEGMTFLGEGGGVGPQRTP